MGADGKHIPSYFPERLRSKVVLPESEDGCWLWTGAMAGQRARTRVREPIPEGKLPAKSPIYSTTERATPMWHDPEVGRPVPAHKALYSRAHGIPFRELPRLRRCPNDRCVSPNHTHPINPLPKPTAIPFLDRLKEKRPVVDLGPVSAAEECGLPPIPAEIWTEFCLWDEANPYEEDAA